MEDEYSDDIVVSPDLELIAEITNTVNNRGGMTDDDLILSIVTSINDTYPIGGGIDTYINIAKSIASYENTNPIDILTSPQYLVEFGRASSFEEKTGLKYYSEDAVADYSNFSSECFLLGKNTVSLNNVSAEEYERPGIICSYTDIDRNLTWKDIDDWPLSGMVGDNSVDIVRYSVHMTPQELSRFMINASFLCSQNGFNGTTSIIDDNGVKDNEGIKEFLTNFWLYYDSNPGMDKSDIVAYLEEQMGNYTFLNGNEEFIDVFSDAVLYGDDPVELELIANDYMTGKNFEDPKGVSDDEALAYGYFLRDFQGSCAFLTDCDINYDPRYGSFVFTYGAVCDNGKLTFQSNAMYDAIDLSTSNYEEYDVLSYPLFVKDYYDNMIAYSLGDKYGVTGLNFISNNDSMVVSYDADAVIDSYYNLNGGTYEYNGFRILIDDSNIANQISYIDDKLINNRNYSSNDFGFYCSLLIDKDDSELRKLGFKGLTTISDKVYDAESDTTDDVVYYQIYLDNGQYVVLENADSYEMDDVVTTVSNSLAMKNNNLHKVISKYYGENTEVDVKYSEYSHEYSVYVNGELIVLSEDDANNLFDLDNEGKLITGSDEILQINDISFPKKNVSNINESSYVDKKFKANCISINDTATYDNFVKLLRENFINKIEEYKTYQNNTYSSVCTHLSDTGEVSRYNSGILKNFDAFTKRSENLILQVDKSINLLTTYDASLKSLINTMIDHLFIETALVTEKSLENGEEVINFTSNLLKNDETFFDDFLAKEATYAKEVYYTLEAAANGYVVLSETDIDNYIAEGLIEANATKPLYEGSNLCKISLENITVPTDDGNIFSWSLNQKNNSLANSINLIYDSVYSESGMTMLLNEKNNYKNYYTYTEKFAKTILSDEFSNMLDVISKNGYHSYLLSDAELALYACSYDGSEYTPSEIVESFASLNTYLNFTSKDAIRDLFTVDGISRKFNSFKDNVDMELVNEITGNSFNGRMGYVTAVNFSDYLLQADDTIFDDIANGVFSFNVGYDNGLTQIPTGIWHLVDPNISSKEYFMQYTNEILNPMYTNEEIEDAYARNQMSTAEYNFRKGVVKNGLQSESNTYKVTMNVGNKVGSAVMSTALSMASIACPALAPFVTAAQVASSAGYKAQQYYVQSGMTTSDAWKARLYGVMSAATSYAANRAICSFGSSYERFDAHGNVFYGNSGGNPVINYAKNKAKQMGANFVTDNLLMGNDDIFGVNITEENSVWYRAANAYRNGYIGNYSNNFWVDYLIDLGTDLSLDFGSDVVVQKFQQNIEQSNEQQVLPHGDDTSDNDDGTQSGKVFDDKADSAIEEYGVYYVSDLAPSTSARLGHITYMNDAYPDDSFKWFVDNNGAKPAPEALFDQYNLLVRNGYTGSYDSFLDEYISGRFSRPAYFDDAIADARKYGCVTVLDGVGLNNVARFESIGYGDRDGKKGVTFVTPLNDQKALESKIYGGANADERAAKGITTNPPVNGFYQIVFDGSRLINEGDDFYYNMGPRNLVGASSAAMPGGYTYDLSGSNNGVREICLKSIKLPDGSGIALVNFMNSSSPGSVFDLSIFGSNYKGITIKRIK